LSADSQLSQVDDGTLKGLRIWDAHAHPHSFFSGKYDATTPTISMMKKLNMAVCVFAAVGDTGYNIRRGDSVKNLKFNTASQLDRVKTWAKSGDIKIIKTNADLDHLKAGEFGAIVAIEGGDALEGKLENLDYFYEEYSVRMITLLHDQINEIGEPQRAALSDKGLTPFGRQLVERMNQRGIVIDVAHAQLSTLRDITALTAKPVVDSHTSLSPKEGPMGRFRSWSEMEMVAKVGGVVCTWPLAYTGRNTLDDWVKEIILMKTRLGIAHIGLGTDGGGRLPKTVKGYQNISDLPKLIKALTEAGLTQNEIQAYVGGNVERVVRACLV